MKSLENGMLVNLPKGKFSAIFERVVLAVNTRKSRVGGVLAAADLRAILRELRVEPADWYAALARAKRTQPNTYELFYRAFGRTPPTQGEASP